MKTEARGYLRFARPSTKKWYERWPSLELVKPLRLPSLIKTQPMFIIMYREKVESLFTLCTVRQWRRMLGCYEDMATGCSMSAGIVATTSGNMVLGATGIGLEVGTSGNS